MAESASFGPVAVRGLRELQRDLGKVNKDAKKELRAALKEAAEPVKAKAQELARSEISHMGESRWSGMRIGVTSKVVYVVPSSRRRGGNPSPNFGALLLDKAMEPALEERASEIFEGIERMLDHLFDKHGL